jgi:penicillin-binding protein 1C
VLKPLHHKAKTKILQHKIKSILILLLLIGYYFCLPQTLFNEPYSTVIESKEGNLLGAKIAHSQKSLDS